MVHLSGHDVVNVLASCIDKNNTPTKSVRLVCKEAVLLQKRWIDWLEYCLVAWDKWGPEWLPFWLGDLRLEVPQKASLINDRQVVELWSSQTMWHLWPFYVTEIKKASLSSKVLKLNTTFSLILLFSFGMRRIIHANKAWIVCKLN